MSLCARAVRSESEALRKEGRRETHLLELDLLEADLKVLVLVAVPRTRLCLCALAPCRRPRDAHDAVPRQGVVPLRDLVPTREVRVEVVLAVERAAGVDAGIEGEAGEEGETDGAGLEDLRGRGGARVSEGRRDEEETGGGLAGRAPGRAASTGATCVLGVSSYTACSAAVGVGEGGREGGVSQERGRVRDEEGEGRRTGQEFGVAPELYVQFQADGGDPSWPARVGCRGGGRGRRRGEAVSSSSEGATTG